MIDIENDIRSLTDFKQNSSEILNHIKKTHSPAILTVNGKAEAVVIDPRTYQNMINRLSLAEDEQIIKQGLIEMEEDQGIDAKIALKKLHQKYSQKLNDKKV